MNEFWKKYKKNIIASIVVVLLCAGSFVCGRTIRLRRAESASSGIEQSISGATGTANKIRDGINSLGDLLGDVGDNNNRAINGVEQSSTDVTELQSIINECVRIIEAGETELADSVKRINTAVDTTDYILQLAEIRAEQNERTLQKLTKLLNQYNAMPSK